jgi:hypothetical protein
VTGETTSGSDEENTIACLLFHRLLFNRVLFRHLPVYPAAFNRLPVIPPPGVKPAAFPLPACSMNDQRVIDDQRIMNDQRVRCIEHMNDQRIMYDQRVMDDQWVSSGEHSERPEMEEEHRGTTGREIHAPKARANSR